MTTEAGDGPSVAPGAGNAELLAAVARALANGDGEQMSVASLQALLGEARLTPEQRTVVEFIDALQSADREARAPHDGGGDEAEALDRDGSIGMLDGRRGRGDVRSELEDLRQVNDTVAAALGACPVCWGGDRRCEVCEGRGRAGSSSPDPELFEELIAPAVRRVWAMRRAKQSGYARSRRW